ncbi:MAG: hypothetical protein MUD14_08770 [Hydrococcus sp. Prado102]|jgi:hypothetical protein|nr:hypothetical protein [Hydrococcus sp. Prado102]
MFPFTNNKQSPFIIPKEREKITLGQLILAGAFILLSFSSCTVALSNKKLAEQKITNVQLADGTAILIQEQTGYYRNPNLIKKFTQQWVSLMFSWDGKIPGTDRADPGVKTPNGKKVPINSWGASLMMEPEFAQHFLDELATLVPESVFTGKLKSSVIVRYQSEPKQINKTTWEINLISDRILFDKFSNAQKAVIPFNKTFTIKAVAIPNSPLKENANTLDKTVYKMRTGGLEIVSIVDYEP